MSSPIIFPPTETVLDSIPTQALPVDVNQPMIGQTPDSSSLDPTVFFIVVMFGAAIYYLVKKYKEIKNRERNAKFKISGFGDTFI